MLLFQLASKYFLFEATGLSKHHDQLVEDFKNFFQDKVTLFILYDINYYW